MEAVLDSWLGRNGMLPHGYCIAWSPGLLWSMVIPDALIAIAYYSIPLVLLRFARLRPDVPFHGVMLLFSAFIFACGTTHLFEIWTVWQPVYGFEAVAKVLTAGISVATAAALWPLLPKALKLPSVQQLQTLVGQLEREVVERRSAQSARAESEQSLDVALASIGAGFIAIDLQGRVTRINPLAEQLTGWLGGSALDRDLAGVFVRRRPGGGPAPLPSVEALSAHGGAGAPGKALGTELVARDGNTIAIEENASLMRAQDGSVRGVAIVFRDVTQQRRHAELQLREVQLQAENRQMQAANKLKNDFLANMSHELRTPLNAIIGFADLMHAGMVDAVVQRQEFLGHIRTSGRHLLRLINDVLDLSKVEAGKLEFHPVETDLEQAAAEVIAILRESASLKQIRLDIEIAPEVRWPVVDAVRLKQVLYNYVSNAIKFTEPGGRIVVRGRAEGTTHFRLEVEDTGMGIAESDLPRLFAQFQQLDHGLAKAHGGTGLGLSLTKRLVEAQGGTVGVTSRLGVGSVFHAVLPMGPGTTQAGVPFEAPRPQADRATILVIEDDADDRARLADALRWAGFDVALAADGAEALRRAADTAFAAITLDLILPDLPGLAVLAAIRSQPGPNQGVPVVVVSVAAESAATTGFAVSDVFVKPVDGQAIVDSLHRAGLAGSAPRDGDAPVLVIDDEPSALRLMAAALESAGYTVVCHQDPLAALAQFDAIAPAAVVLDLMMPGVDGLQVLDAIRSRDRGRSIPVFIWTAKDLTPDEYRRLSAAAQAIVHKGDEAPGAWAARVGAWVSRHHDLHRAVT